MSYFNCIRGKMIRAALQRSLAPTVSRFVRPGNFVALGAQRVFSSTPDLGATAQVYEEYVAKAVKAYEADAPTINAFFDNELANNKVVLFMDGTVDAPKSALSLNVVKMLTDAQAQHAGMVAIDVMKHPAILGYTVSKTRNSRAPHLYVNGAYYGDHFGIMQKWSSGELKTTLGTDSTLSKGGFKGELPIAMY